MDQHVYVVSLSLMDCSPETYVAGVFGTHEAAASFLQAEFEQARAKRHWLDTVNEVDDVGTIKLFEVQYVPAPASPS